MAELKVVTLGGKSSPLSSSSVYAVATGQAQLVNDSSAVSGLLAHQNSTTPLKPFQIPFPKTLTPLEFRASLVFLLNKLLLFSHPTNTRTFLPNLISKTLNSESETGIFDSIDLTDKEQILIEKSSPYAYGVCSILDHVSMALASIVDAVAALSCEAGKGDVVSFNCTDIVDGYVDKGSIGVAGDMMVLLSGSELVGKVQNESFSKIPKINGRWREVVKLLQSISRMALNSHEEVDEGDTIAVIIALVSALQNLGNSCLCQAKINLQAIGNESLKDGLLTMFQGNCPDENVNVLKNAYKLALDSEFEGDTGNFMHEVNALLGIVWKIVASAFVALEGGELTSVNDAKGIEVTGNSEKVVKKEREAILGEGTSLIVQIIKDRLQGMGEDSSDGRQVLEKWVADLLFFDPKEPEFGVMVQKEMVESNQSWRLPKLPEGTCDIVKEQMTKEKTFSIMMDDLMTDNFKVHTQWQWEEDKLLMNAWLNVSMDFNVGTDKKCDAFWSRIHHYCEESNPGFIKRGPMAMKKRWHRINLAAQRFGGCYDHASRKVGGGSNRDNVMELAHQVFLAKYKKKCNFERHWNKLRWEKKWRTPKSHNRGSKRIKISGCGAYSSSSKPEMPAARDTIVESQAHPKVSDAAEEFPVHPKVLDVAADSPVCPKVSDLLVESPVCSKVSDGVESLVRPKVSDTAEESPVCPKVLEADMESPVHLKGTNSSKGKGKSKALDIGDIVKEELEAIKSSTSRKLTLIEELKIVKQREIDMKQREIDLKEMELEIQLLTADTSSMNWMQQQIHAKMLEKLKEKYN